MLILCLLNKLVFPHFVFDCLMLKKLQVRGVISPPRSKWSLSLYPSLIPKTKHSTGYLDHLSSFESNKFLALPTHPTKYKNVYP